MKKLRDLDEKILCELVEIKTLLNNHLHSHEVWTWRFIVPLVILGIGTFLKVWWPKLF